MFRYALVAVCSFALGVLVRDVAQDHRDAKVSKVLSEERKTCEVFARALAHLYNGGSLIVADTTAVSCKTRAWGKS